VQFWAISVQKAKRIAATGIPKKTKGEEIDPSPFQYTWSEIYPDILPTAGI